MSLGSSTRHKLFAVACALCACSLLGCRFVRGVNKKSGAAPNASQAGRLTGNSWIDGKLPASVLQGQPRDGGELVFQIDVNPPSLNPIIDSDYWAAQITSNHVYESLVTVDPYDEPRFRFLPALAETWEISPDGRVYTFHLRKSVTWHDGHPFSAADVIATFDKIQDTTSKAASIRSYTQEIDRYEAIDASTIRFYLKRPYFLMMDGVFASVPIQPSHIIKTMTGLVYSESASNPINRAPIGTGPYRIEKWDNGQMIALRRNSGYWGKRPHIDRVIYRIVQEESVMLELAERGEVDVVSRVRANQWIKLGQSKLQETFNRILFYEANYRWIGWNLRRPQFQDSRVRRALTMLTDRPGIINSLLHGLAKPTVCHFYWASTACDQNLQPLPYDPVEAVRLLEQAGWVDRDGDGIRDFQGRRFEFSFMIPAASDEAARIGTKMKEDFFRAGIDLKLQRVEWSAFVRRLRTHDFDACTLLWSGEPRGDPTQIWSSNSIDGGSNYISFSNPVADRLMREARGELDDGRRDRLYQEFGRILHNEQPYTWLYVRPTMTLLNRRIKGIKQTLLGWVLEDWWLESELNRTGGAR